LNLGYCVTSSLFNYIDAVARTDVGKQRRDNQDAFGVVKTDSLHAFFIADGMGGANGGAVASSKTIRSICNRLKTTTEVSLDSIHTAVVDANSEIFKLAAYEPSLNGMGTTVVGLAMSPHGCYLFNVGDSRAYRFRERELHQITRDHTVLNELVELGSIDEDSEFKDSISHMLTRSIGPSPDVEVDVYPIGIEEGDVFLLCSDGLYGMMSEREMYEILNSFEPAKAVDQFVDRANRNGGSDNITVLIVKVQRGYGSLLPRRNEDAHPLRLAFSSELFNRKPNYSEDVVTLNGEEDINQLVQSRMLSPRLGYSFGMALMLGLLSVFFFKVL
jgi:PPM family protein phosphatase